MGKGKGRGGVGGRVGVRGRVEVVEVGGRGGSHLSPGLHDEARARNSAME